MRRTVSEMARLCSVSVRTLHYYDSIGLLRPMEVTESGYRYYGEEAVFTLQRILFYRELGFSLREIRTLLSAPDDQEALEAQSRLLRLKRDRLDRLLKLLDAARKGEKRMDFSVFDTKELEEAKAAYAKEAEARWGNTQAWVQSQAREKTYSKEDQKELEAQSEEIFRRFAGLRGSDPASPEVQAAVEDWQRFITDHWYDCTDEILKGLGVMYTADERFRKNLDRFGPGTAELMSAAIAARCGK